MVIVSQYCYAILLQQGLSLWILWWHADEKMSILVESHEFETTLCKRCPISASLAVLGTKKDNAQRASRSQLKAPSVFWIPHEEEYKADVQYSLCRYVVEGLEKEVFRPQGKQTIFLQNESRILCLLQ